MNTTIHIKIFLFKCFGVSFLTCMEVLFSLWHASYKTTDKDVHASFCYLYLTLYLSQMALPFRVYPSVPNIKLPLPLLPIYLGSLVFFQYKFLLLGGESVTVKIKCFAQEQNTLTWSGVKRGPLDPESNTLTIESPYLLYKL